MEKSKLLTDKLREYAEKYPLYSQDGEGGAAVVWWKIFFTGTATTIYVTEAQADGEFDGRENYTLFGVGNINGSGYEYGYFSLAEIEGINLQGGLIHPETDLYFTPRPIGKIDEVAASLSHLWGDEDEDKNE